MKNDRALMRAIRLAIGGAIGLSTAAVGQVATGQQSGEQMEEVTVTGSRIARPSDLDLFWRVQKTRPGWCLTK